MKYAFLGAALALSTILATGASAQNRNCGNRDAIIERLTQKYGEARTGGGLTHANGMVEVYTSTETGTWTILITTPAGMSCLVAAGEFWDDKQVERITPSGVPL